MNPLLALILVPLMAAAAVSLVAWLGSRPRVAPLQASQQAPAPSIRQAPQQALPTLALAAILVVATLFQGFSLWQLYATLTSLDTSTYVIGQWMAPLGVYLVADGLAWIMVLSTTLIGLLVALYSLLYLRKTIDTRQQRRFWPMFWLLQTILNGIWLSADLFSAYIGLELLTFTAVSLIIVNGTSKSLAAGLRYLYTGLLSSLCVLLGVALLYSVYGTLSYAALSAQLNNDWTTQTALLFITLGLLVKTAIVPFHRWLPPAHGVALAPVSALHAALVAKTSFYIMARLWLDTGAGLMPMGVAQGLGLLGAVSIFYGGYQALQQRDIKMLVAYSTIAQLGYLLLVFPLSTGTGTAAATLAWQGSMLHLTAHAFAKAGLFLSVSTLVATLGSKRLRALAGISSRMPVSLMAFGLACVSLMGLPPSGGFNAKWLMLQSALVSGQWHWVVVLLGGSLVTALYVFKVFSISFDQRAAESLKQAPPIAWGLELTALALAAVAIVLGFAAAGPVALLATGVQS